MARCTQNFKLSNSTLLIQFNDSTDFDELTKPVSSLPEEGLRFCNQTELVGLANMNTQLPGRCSDILGKMGTTGGRRKMVKRQKRLTKS
ncbi:BnaC05g34940D [Brassica napus]|uniref:(rape) hypothetical protein n=1 Tax=Brassica napus TaxID=3708 RepID=A0A078GD86_BRANA|nr:unnamed protein product [Brassica napus]CDY24460.1 BnaC05g34940D [Brassica napus]